MKRYVYDIELMGGNFFCVTFMNVLDTSEVLVFTIFKEVDQLNELIDFLNSEITIVGFNNISYDAPVMQFIIQNKTSNRLLEDAFEFSSDLIHMEKGGYHPELKQYQYPENVKYNQIDLMKIIEVNGNVPSLKQVGINLQWHKIQDLPLPFDHKVENWNEANLIISYNLNDVWISLKLYEKIYKDIILREQLSEMYSLNLMSDSDSKIGDKLLEKFYKEKTGEINVRKLKDFIVEREQFYIKDCLPSDVEFKTNYFKRILKEISETLVRKTTNYAMTKIVNFGGVEYKVASGGLHSVDFPARFFTDDKYILRDCDFSSYYTSMMIKNKVKPEHVKDDFLVILDEITKERVKAKATDKVKAAALKVTVNSVYGKLGFAGSWFRDNMAVLKVTLPGQLYLLMMIESFVLAGIQVISANTDGIVCRIPRELEETYYSIANGFAEKVGIGVEFTDYKQYFRRDINNYISEKPYGEEKDRVKTKGVYIPYAEIKKGYKYPIVPKAVYQYVINNIPIEETLYSHRNILDFCASQKMGSDFVAEYHKDDKTVEILQKTNRFYISKSGGKLIKRRKGSTAGEMEFVTWISDFARDEKGEPIKKEKGVIGLYVGKKVRMLNDFDSSIDFSQYDIDYDYYLSECRALLDDAIIYNETMEAFVDEEEGFVPENDGKQKDELFYSLRGMKGLADKVVDNLLWINNNSNETSFVEFLVLAENNSMVASKFEDLIKIGYFSQYGSGKKLLKFFQEFRKGKSKYTNKLAEKSKVKRLGELQEIWNRLPEEEFSVMEKISNELSILGRIETKFEGLKGRMGFVIDLDTKNSPKAKIQSLKFGNIETFKVARKIFAKKEFCVGQILSLPDGGIDKKQSVRFAGEDENGKPKYDPIEGKYDYWLLDYSIVNEI